MTRRRGVYFVANDAILDLAVAFLNSFRLANPSAELCLIPFDHGVDALKRLQTKYNFIIFDDITLLHRCDKISQHFFGTTCGQFRKLAAWEGPFDDFIYIDTDTVVLKNLEFVYDYLAYFGFVVSHSDMPAIRKWVWKDSIYSAKCLTWKQISFSANTGFIASAKERLSIEESERKLIDVEPVIPHMELHCAEQPYLNYLIVTSNEDYSSLTTIKRLAGLTWLPLEYWGGAQLGAVCGAKQRYNNDNILLVHWAGQWAPTAVDSKAHKFLSNMGIRVRPPTTRFFMRNKSLWRYYRYLANS